jgi:divalent metal cation (Fe/Co/Zn/Cd) transporter
MVAVQLLLTVAVLAKDLEVAFWIDGLGAILISLLIVVGGVKLAWECICDLIDHPLDRDQERAMVAALARGGVEPEELVDLRTRRCAERIFAELTLHTGETVPVEAVCRRLAGLRRILEAEIQGLDLVIKLQRSEP